jgi:hypothetical protein
LDYGKQVPIDGTLGSGEVNGDIVKELDVIEETSPFIVLGTY